MGFQRYSRALRAPRASWALCVVLIVAACATPPAPLDGIVLPAGSPFPENVAASADGSLFVSSISHGGVLKFAPGTATSAVFLQPGDHGTRSTFGLLVDDQRGTLWVASNDASGIGLKGPSTVEGAWVKGFDVKSGALKVSARLPKGPAIANDFAIASDGSLYITNTAAPQILRLKDGASDVEIFVQDDVLKGGLDGIAFGKDGHLYVNTYLSGEMFRIEVRDGSPGRITKLKTSKPLNHPDGMRPYKDGFLMVEGAGPLSRIKIDGDTVNFETVMMMTEPTGVAITRERIWVSEGQLSYLSPEKKASTPERFGLRSLPHPRN